MSSGEEVEVARDRMRKYDERRERVAVNVESTSLFEVQHRREKNANHNLRLSLQEWIMIVGSRHHPNRRSLCVGGKAMSHSVHDVFCVSIS